MKLSVTQPSLSKALSIVGRAVSSRSTMPVLSNIMLEAKGNQLRLSAMNREIGINCWIAANVSDEGSTTIPARLLSEFVNNLPPEQIVLDLAARTQTLHLSCARFEANMKGIDAFEFPLIPTYQPEVVGGSEPSVIGATYAIEPGVLSTMISSVAYAASQDENRPTLTGVKTTFADGKLTMAATDGYRLSVRSAEVATAANAMVVIPGKNLSEMARICNDAAGEINAVVSDNRILFSATSTKDWQRVDVVSELIDARFPDYTATIPKSYTTHTTVDTAALLKAVRVALLFARDNSNIVHLSLSPGQLRLAATSAEMGDNVSELDANVRGDSLGISFNAKYLIDALSQVATPQVILETTVGTRPGVLKPVGSDDFLQVLMPMHPPK